MLKKEMQVYHIFLSFWSADVLFLLALLFPLNVISEPAFLTVEMSLGPLSVPHITHV